MSKHYGEGSQIIWTDKKRFLGMPITFTRYTLAVKEDDWQKIFIKTGLLSTTIGEINLYRIYDITVHQSLSQKIFGVGTVYLHSNDVTTPVKALINIKNPFNVRNIIAELVEKSRDLHNVRVGEVY